MCIKHLVPLHTYKCPGTASLSHYSNYFWYVVTWAGTWFSLQKWTDRPFVWQGIISEMKSSYQKKKKKNPSKVLWASGKHTLFSSLVARAQGDGFTSGAGAQRLCTVATPGHMRWWANPHIYAVKRQPTNQRNIKSWTQEWGRKYAFVLCPKPSVPIFCGWAIPDMHTLTLGSRAQSWEYWSGGDWGWGRAEWGR